MERKERTGKERVRKHATETKTKKEKEKEKKRYQQSLKRRMFDW